MLRRLPAGDRVVGHHGRDDPGRVLGRGALDGPADRVVAEPAAARPVPGHLREHGVHHPDERLPAREDLHDAAGALRLSVGALTHVVGAQSDVVLVGEIQMGRGVGLGLLRHLGHLGTEALNPGGGESVELPHEIGVALGEHGLQDAQHGALFLPGRRVAGGVAHQMHDAALPCGTRVGVDDVLAGRAPAGRRLTRPATSTSSTPGRRSCGLCPCSVPMLCATRFTFMVDTPLVTISDTAAMTARSTRENRSTRSSGK